MNANITERTRVMTNERFNDIVKEQLTRCVDTLCIKGDEYGEDFDRLSHFKVAGALQKRRPEDALVGMMCKHIVSVVEMSRTPGYFTEDQWNEKIGDSINYLLLLSALIREDDKHA